MGEVQSLFDRFDHKVVPDHTVTDDDEIVFHGLALWFVVGCGLKHFWCKTGAALCCTRVEASAVPIRGAERHLNNK